MDAARQVATANNKFAFDLCARLRQDSQNLFFSPFSVFAALAMTYGGARGETAVQMAATLHLAGLGSAAHMAVGRLLQDICGGSAGRHYSLQIANALWKRQGLEFLPRFVDLMREHYGAEPQEADFAGAVEEACRRINAWVMEQTQGRIRDLVHPHANVAPDTLTVLVNAIYFKARWDQEFWQPDTEPEEFFLTPEQTIPVPTMRMESEHRQFGFFDAGSFKLLELAYETGALSMLLLLPEKLEGLSALESRLDADLLATSIAALKRSHVRIHIPKFRVEARYLLKPALSALGMPLVFAAAADFSGITVDEPVMIGQVIHQSFVSVDEEGTEAAAATAVVAELGATIDFDEPQWVSFRADHPFLFMIRHVHSGSILFMGRIMNPACQLPGQR